MSHPTAIHGSNLFSETLEAPAAEPQRTRRKTSSPVVAAAPAPSLPTTRKARGARKSAKPTHRQTRPHIGDGWIQIDRTDGYTDTFALPDTPDNAELFIEHCAHAGYTVVHEPEDRKLYIQNSMGRFALDLMAFIRPHAANVVAATAAAASASNQVSSSSLYATEGKL